MWSVLHRCSYFYNRYTAHCTFFYDDDDDDDCMSYFFMFVLDDCPQSFQNDTDMENARTSTSSC